MRVALDELPAVKVWGLRNAGLIGRGTRSVVIEAGGSLLTVAVEETPMKNGGVHWHFRCPGCGRRAKVLRLLGERVICFRCCAATGLWYHRPVPEAGQRALIAHKRMNRFVVCQSAIAIREVAAKRPSPPSRWPTAVAFS